jgi:hypothetical protein
MIVQIFTFHFNKNESLLNLLTSRLILNTYFSSIDFYEIYSIMRFESISKLLPPTLDLNDVWNTDKTKKRNTKYF